MTRSARMMCLFVITAMKLLGWESEPELVVEGILRRAERTLITKYPNGTMKSRIEKSLVLVTDEPVVLSRSVTLGDHQMVVQKKTLPHLDLGLGEEFLSLIGKKVKLYGSFAQPFDFFFRDEVKFEVSTALDSEWMCTHQPIIVPYEPKVVRLTGKLYKKVYPGPPEYANIDAGDQPETVLILALTEPIDVESTMGMEDDGNEAEKGVLEIHIIFLDSAPSEYLMDQKIVVEGTLFHAHTGHHRRRVLMLANDWKSIP
jgi:hypothetical protein